jgi:UDP-N-acetylglucosamine diphosphorylase/glucosamine-1-phosphate N-acetyltransferase
MNCILFDDSRVRSQLLPFTYTRPVSGIRIGIMSIAEKWEFVLQTKISNLTEPYLSEKFPCIIHEDNILINACCTPSESLIRELNALKSGTALVQNNILLAARLSESDVKPGISFSDFEPDQIFEAKSPVFKISRPWDIFIHNGAQIESDFQMLTKNKKSRPLSSTNKAIKPELIFIEEGAIVECSILNASAGPIYIGKDAEIMEGCMVRGPFALGEHASLKMGCKVYGPTTIGPHSKVGGEISNSVVFGYSNKAHDGFLGNSVIGEWCNLGADTNNSNLKNNYSNVKVWDYDSADYIDTALIFCGLFMGDFSRSGINTMFNTGTTTGVNANVFGSGFPAKMIPSFSWGGAEVTAKYRLEEAVLTAKKVYERRGLVFGETDEKIFLHLFNNS